MQKTALRTFFVRCALIAAGVAFPHNVFARNSTPEKPNIVYIMSDDQGYGDAKCFNPECGFPTPGIDRLCSLFEIQSEQEQLASLATVNRLFLLTLPAHLQLNEGRLLDPTDRDVLRAKIIRQTLSQNLC